MRKQLKKQALQRMKKCYWLMVVLCLIMGIAGINYTTSWSMISLNLSEEYGNDILTDVYTQILTGNTEDGQRMSAEYVQNKKETTDELGIVAIGHSRGVLAQLVNNVSSGQLLNTLYSAINSITESRNFTMVIFIFLSLVFLIIVRIFIYNTFRVTVKRFALEYGIYEKVPLKRFLYLLRGKWLWNSAITIFITNVLLTLWTFTVVGALIKTRSYQMVPYILAENPDVKPNQAITLSRKMMDGHKWESFKLSLSFIGWFILELFTFGLSGIFFSNSYRELTWAEYYTYIRGLAKEKEIPGSELLNDVYLYEKADDSTLAVAYDDVDDTVEEIDWSSHKHSGIRGFLENTFGITFSYDSDEANYQTCCANQHAYCDYKEILEKKMYPYRLFALESSYPEIKLSPIQYDRHYTLVSLVYLFFILSMVGWCWEVSLHLVADGEFVNRGTLHGPWLPIYGYGATLILVVLYRFRKNGFLEFISGIILCGAVEYGTAWYLETTHGGTKWWDYTGYFLNIHGRICAEGLLIFGLGGLATVYLLAPFLDNHVRQIPKKIATLVAIVLLTAYIGDSVYSHYYPNQGKGITDYTGYETMIQEEGK